MRADSRNENVDEMPSESKRRKTPFKLSIALLSEDTWTIT